MGCGKTTMGRKLANFLGYEFFDLDKLIEANVGMTIPEYFQAHGEEAFRILENETLQQTNFPEKTIISTGGGAPCFYDNMAWMNQHGKSIYMCLSSQVLANRLENAKTERPLIKGKKGQVLVDFITQKLAEREGFYKQAQFSVSSNDLTVDRFAEQIGMEPKGGQAI